MDLIMPEKYKQITIKIVSNVYVSGNDAYVDVRLFGNPKDWTYRMKLGKTLWFSIQQHLQELDNNRFSEELEPAVLEENLGYLNGRIVTVKATSDERMTFKTKSGGVEYGKRFVANFRSDLEEAETLGGDVLKKAIFETVLDNIMGKDCIIANSNLAKAEIEKEEEKNMTIEERRKRNFEKSEVEWVVKKREDDKKKEEIKEKRGDCAGW